jgi:hypothetical protein
MVGDHEETRACEDEIQNIVNRKFLVPDLKTRSDREVVFRGIAEGKEAANGKQNDHSMS